MLDWKKYIAIAKRFQFRAKFEDRGDLCQSIILALARAELSEGNNGNGALSDKALTQSARYECQKYWRQMRRNNRLISLSRTLENGDGSRIELAETIPDNKSVDLDAWLDAKSFLLSCPRRLLEIATKLVTGHSLNNKEHQYLWRYRQKDRHKR